MRSMAFSMAAILALAVGPSVYARIGETPQQCQARCGAPIKVDRGKGLMAFQSRGIKLMIQFYNGKADMITFRKAQQDILGFAEGFSDNEIQIFLKAHGLGHEWKESTAISMDKQWSTDDGQVVANPR